MVRILQPIFTSANYATLNFFTIGAVVLIGLELEKTNKRKGMHQHLLLYVLMLHVVHLLLTSHWKIKK